jgi:hypothetical protein
MPGIVLPHPCVPKFRFLDTCTNKNVHTHTKYRCIPVRGLPFRVLFPAFVVTPRACMHFMASLVSYMHAYKNTNTCKHIRVHTHTHMHNTQHTPCPRLALPSIRPHVGPPSRLHSSTPCFPPFIVVARLQPFPHVSP